MAGTLGDTLASARRSLGRTLSEAEAATRIRGKLLEALERGEYGALPNPAYVRGYIISYAKFLELDAGPLLKLYAEETGAEKTSDALRVPAQVVPTRQQTQSIPWPTILAIVAVVLVLVLAVWGIGRLISGPDEPPPIPVVPEPTATVDPGGSVISTETTAPDAGAPIDDPDETDETGEPFVLRIVVASDAASWLRITVDGLKAYEGTLSGGQTKEFDVTDEAVIRIGKPSAVTVFRDGEPVEIPPAAETPELTLSVTDPTP